MADNSTQGGADTIRDKDRAGVKTQIFGLDLNPNGATEVLQSAAALADATANPTVPAWAALGLLFNGTTWDRMRGDTTNGLDVDVTRLPSLPAGAAVIGKVDINSAPQVAVNNVETLTDNAGFTDGTSKLFPQGYIFDESAGTALTENDVAAARVDSKRAVVNVLEDATTRGRRAIVSATGGLLGDQGAPAAQTNAWFVRPRKLATYKAVFRTAARPYSLSKAFTANTRVQFATIHHAAAAAKTCRLRSVKVFFESTSVGGFLDIDLVRITTAPTTGAPAITASKSDSSDAAAEATTLALPGTAGTEEAQVFTSLKYAPSVTAAQAAAYPQIPAPYIELLDVPPMDDERKAPVIRAGVLEGWAVVFDMNAAATVIGGVQIEWTEE